MSGLEPNKFLMSPEERERGFRLVPSNICGEALTTTHAHDEKSYLILMIEKPQLRAHIIHSLLFDHPLMELIY